MPIVRFKGLFKSHQRISRWNWGANLDENTGVTTYTRQPSSRHTDPYFLLTVVLEQDSGKGPRVVRLKVAEKLLEPKTISTDFEMSDFLNYVEFVKVCSAVAQFQDLCSEGSVLNQVDKE